MIEKFSNIILAIWIAVLSSGFAVNNHFCGNDLDSAGINIEKESCHLAGGMEDHPKGSCHKEEQNTCEGAHALCCSDIIQYYKNQTDHKSGLNLSLKVLYTFTYSLFGELANQDFSYFLKFPKYFSPPVGQDVFLLVQSFLL